MKRLISIALVAVLGLTMASETAYAGQRCETCERDSHGRIKRSPGTKAAFRADHPCPATGKITGACHGYVIDHVQALKHGGKDAPANMQWQTKEDAKAKDLWE